MRVSCIHCRIVLDHKQLSKHTLSKSCGRNIKWAISGKGKSGKKPKIKECITCHAIFSGGRSEYCSVVCSKNYMTDDIRNNISEKRKAYLKNNPEKHPWKKSEKYKSVPCEKVKEFLRSLNIKFVEEWNPLEDRHYSIDIAFPDIKLGIEINGNQHYNRDGSLKEYYKARHDVIVSSGWKLLELHYSIAFDLQKIKDLIDIKEQPDYTEYFREKKNKHQTLPKGARARMKSDAKWEEYKEKVTNSEIDFSKFGWVTEVSKILNIKSQKVSKWMKRYLPEFYNDKCFKRKFIPLIPASVF